MHSTSYHDHSNEAGAETIGCQKQCVTPTMNSWLPPAKQPMSASFHSTLVVCTDTGAEWRGGKAGSRATVCIKEASRDGSRPLHVASVFVIQAQHDGGGDDG